MGNEGSVVSKEEVMELLLKCFCVGMQSPVVKQTSVKSIADVCRTVILKVFYAEKDAEQNRCQNTTLFHVIDDGEGPRVVAVQPNLAVMVFVELDNNAEELWWAAKALHDHPQSLSAHCVKRFSQVPKCYIQFFVLLPAFLLELSDDDYHICGAPDCSKLTLGFWLMVFSNGGYQSFSEYTSKDFSSDGDQSDPSLVGAICLFSLVFVQGDDDCIMEIPWKFSLLTTTNKEFMDLTM